MMLQYIEFSTAASSSGSSDFFIATVPGGAPGGQRSTVVALCKAAATTTLGVPLTSPALTGVEAGKEGAGVSAGSTGTGPLDLINGVPTTDATEGDGHGDDSKPNWLSGWYDSPSGSVEGTVSTSTTADPGPMFLTGVATGTTGGTWQRQRHGVVNNNNNNNNNNRSSTHVPDWCHHWNVQKLEAP